MFLAIALNIFSVIGVIWTIYATVKATLWFTRRKTTA